MNNEYEMYLKKANEALSENNTDDKQKLEVFQELYRWLSECFPIESRKIGLYSVNRVNGKIDCDYLLKYSKKGYIEKNIMKIIDFIGEKQRALKTKSSNDTLFLKFLRIDNFRSISNMNIHFNKGINVLIGDNGVGKSSILDAISLGLIDIVRPFNVTRKKFNESDISINSGIASIQYIIQDSNNEYYSYRAKNRNRIIPLIPLNPLNSSNFKSFSEYLPNALLYPIISYHSISNDERRTIYKSKQKDAAQGYVGCLNGKADIQWVESWLSESKKSEIKKFLLIINEFISKMLDKQDLTIKYKKDKFYIQSSQGDIPLEYMSSGFQTMLNLVIDISYRLTVLNPSIENPTSMFGIVLIDEIELHLHPKWQWKILSVLEDTFPNIQFIVTTHSPMVISSCKKCNLLLLTRNENDDIECVPQVADGLYGKSIEDVMQYNMDSRNIPDNLYSMYENFYKLYSAGQYKEAKKQLDEMQKSYGYENGTVKSAEFIMNISFDDKSEE